MTPTTTTTTPNTPPADATLPFECSICGEGSGQICVFCTKDCCANHRCERCERCSDCCDCDNGKRVFRTANGAPPSD